MSVTIQEVFTRKQLKDFINFPYRMYKGNASFVPPLKFDEVMTLRRDKNPAFDYCEARMWLAYKDNRVVGRVAAIINLAYIEKWKNPYLRFGWIDFENDLEIVKSLMTQVESWAKEKGLTAVVGPLGFTDLDHEGMLVEGFDQLGTLATIYNHPYYPELLSKLGYVKDADWVEYKIKIPNQVPEKLDRASSVVARRYGLSPLKAKSSKEILPYAGEIFELINDAYSHLYGVVPLTERQIKYYTKAYFSFIRTDFVSLILDKQGKLAAFGITMPSLSRALQKAGGSLFPFGFIYIIMALRKSKLGDLYLVAVRKDLQGKGVNAMLMSELTKNYIRNGVEFAESNPELENNVQVQALWEYYDVQQHKRRRSFIKKL
jgi:GNAT superfamily N-acetyltransferase